MTTAERTAHTTETAAPSRSGTDYKRRLGELPWPELASTLGLVGLAASHTRGHVIRAVMEGVAFSLRDSLTIFPELNVPVEKIRLGGGGARSPLWRQIQADVYGRAVEILAAEEGAAFGAAILAGVGSKIWPGVDEACDQAIHVSESIACQPHVAKLMNERYRDYQRLYPALHSLYSQDNSHA